MGTYRTCSFWKVCARVLVTADAIASSLDVAPDDVAAAWTPLSALFDHALLLGRHEIEQWIATHVHEAVRLQQRLDLLPRSAPEEWELVANCRVLLAAAGILRGWRRGAGVELSVHDDEAPSRSEDANPPVDRRLGVL